MPDKVKRLTKKQKQEAEDFKYSVIAVLLHLQATYLNIVRLEIGDDEFLDSVLTLVEHSKILEIDMTQEKNRHAIGMIIDGMYTLFEE